MENTKLVKIAESLPTVLKNTTFNINLEGWPAAITAIAFFGSCLGIYALKVTHPSSESAASSEKEVSAA